ncbi:TIGR04282 family arsenosugar biosynthesis glycosyltransferase [Aeromicrobium sp.]|uniref:TIGR04282 family arsenosugar biosynthesis glycosyltransferase n=1 Tax=Aeromicrobium sp. TaxID=1871063 RepID=UPI003C56F95C
MSAPTVLIVAKAPVPGLAKTRIAQSVGDVAAAEVAAAALLDTLMTATSVGWPVVVAVTGDLDHAIRGDEITAALATARVVEQRGAGLGERLANAHADADAGRGVIQVGMDTPQLTVADYLDAGRMVELGSRVIGPAGDGGWWLLGLPDPDEAHGLIGVEMSQGDTGEQTELALGGNFVRLRSVRDMDTWDDAVEIAEHLPISQLAWAVRDIVANAAAEAGVAEAEGTEPPSPTEEEVMA